MRFLPREKSFILCSKQVDLIAEASRLLLEGMRHGQTRVWPGAATDIVVLENRGDEVIHEIFTRLNQTFITPIDPEDIHNVSSALDDVLDGIEDTSHRLVSYRIDPIPQTMMTLAELVAACAKNLKAQSRRWRKTGRSCRIVSRSTALKMRPTASAGAPWPTCSIKETDPIKLIKLKEIYEFFEATIDSCEDVADVLQNVVVKNS